MDIGNQQLQQDEFLNVLKITRSVNFVYLSYTEKEHKNNIL